MKTRRIISVILVVLMFVMVAIIVAQPVSAADQQLEILNGPLVITPDKDQDDRMVAVVIVSNNGPDIAQLTFKAVSDDGQKIDLHVNNNNSGIPKYSVNQFEVEFLNLGTEKITGHLIIEAQDVSPADTSLTLEPGQPDKSQAILWLDQLDTSLIILISFLIGFVLVVLVSFPLIVRKYKIVKNINFSEMLHYRMSGLKWDFTQNWASTLVAVGGILAIVVGSKVMPENPVILSTQGFQVLNILFPILIVVAPFLLTTLNALGKEPEDKGTLILDSENKTPLLILPFVMGSAIVTWAVIGELMTLAVLFQELYLADYVSNGIAQSAQIFLLLLCLLGLYYTAEKIVQISLSAKSRDELKKPLEEMAGTKDGRRSEGKIERPVYLP